MSPLEAAGCIQRFRGYRAWSTPEFVVDSSEPLIDVGVDGEALRLRPRCGSGPFPVCCVSARR